MKYCVTPHCRQPVGKDDSFCARHWQQVPRMLREDVLRYGQQKNWPLWARAVVRARQAVLTATPPGEEPVPTA